MATLRGLFMLNTPLMAVLRVDAAVGADQRHRPAPPVVFAGTDQAGGPGPGRPVPYGFVWLSAAAELKVAALTP